MKNLSLTNKNPEYNSYHPDSIKVKDIDENKNKF